MTKEKRKELLTTSELIGIKVVNPMHEELGNIQDITIDPVNGNIVYAVVTFGGFMGFGEKRFAMPWEGFYLDTNTEDVVILNVDKKKLEKAPGLEDDDFPLSGQWEFVDRTYRYYGYKEYTLRRPIGRTHAEMKESETTTAGLGNSGEAATFQQAGFQSNRIKQTGLN